MTEFGLKSLKEMQAEGRAYSEAHGWYDVPRTWGEEMALLHSEASEALDAYRQWGLDDMTESICTKGEGEWDDDHSRHLCKPEGVGSELADVLIRLLDTCERHGIDIEAGGDAVGWSTRIYDPEVPFGDMINDLHDQINKLSQSRARKDIFAALIYTELKSICRAINIDLEEEYERKYAFNQTRPYRHGNKRL